MTYTALLIQFNTFEKDVARFEVPDGGAFAALGEFWGVLGGICLREVPD